MKLLTLLLTFLLCNFAQNAFAAEGEWVQRDIARARLVTQEEAPEKITVGLEVALPPEWHIYSDPPGDAGLATAIAWKLPQGVSASPIAWPTPQTFHEGDLTVYGYTSHVILPVTLTGANAAGATLSAQATWLACKDICIPEQADLSLTLPENAAAPASAAATPELAAVLLLALLGGLVLNLMPCVLPVLSLKILALSRQQEAAYAKRHALAYTAGVLLGFAAIAGLLIALAQGGAAIGWGYQMQSPPFVAFLVLLLFAVGLNLSGAFELPVLFGRAAAHAAHENALGSFASGLLAVLIATPCTAPFMAAAVAYALAQPPLVALLVFEALGLGLALPFLLMGFAPPLRRCLPKPGAWMKHFRELLAFPLYLTVAWLLWVLARQGGTGTLAAALCGMVALTFALWAARLFPAFSRIRTIACLLMVALVFIATVYATRPVTSHTALGEPYSAVALKKYRNTGTPVFIDATAAWCLTCQINERVVLKSESVKQAFAQRKIALLVADWTHADAEVTALLERFGRRGVPLYVYLPPQGEPRVLPQLLTQGLVLEALEAQ